MRSAADQSVHAEARDNCHLTIFAQDDDLQGEAIDASVVTSALRPL